MTIGDQLDLEFDKYDAALAEIHDEIAALKERMTAVEGGVVTPPPPPPPPPADRRVKVAATAMSGTGGQRSTENAGWESPEGYIGRWNTGNRQVALTASVAGRALLKLRYRATTPCVREITIAGETKPTSFLSTTTAWADQHGWKVQDIWITVPQGPFVIDIDAVSTWMDLDWAEIVVDAGSIAVLPPPPPPDLGEDGHYVDPDIGSSGELVVDHEIAITDPREPFRLENRTLICTGRSGASAGIAGWVNDARIIGPGKIRWTPARDGRAIANRKDRMIIEGDVLIEAGPWDGCGVQSIGREFGDGEGFLIHDTVVVQPRPDAGAHGVGGLFGYGASTFGMFGFKQHGRRSEIKKLVVIGARNHVTEVHNYSPNATDGGGIHMGDMSSGTHHVQIDHLVVRDVDGCGAVLFSSPFVTAHIDRFDGIGIGLYSGHPALGPGRVMQVHNGNPTGGEGRYISGQFAISSYLAGRITYRELIQADRPMNGDVVRV